MRLEDLKDPKDRDAMERVQRGRDIHDIRREDAFRGRVSKKSQPSAGYDKAAEAEFQGKTDAQNRD